MGILLAAGTAPVWIPAAGAVILIYGAGHFSYELGDQLGNSVGRSSQFKEVWEKMGMSR